MTAADHANTVRKAHAQAMEALGADVHGYSGPAIRDWEKELDAALDALQAQAETAEANERKIARLSKDLQDLQRANDDLRRQNQRLRR